MRKTLLFITFIFSTSMSQATTVNLQTNAQVRRLNENNFVEKKSGESVEISSGESLLIIPNKSVPLIYTSSAPNSVVTITDTNVASALAETIQEPVEKATNEIVSRMTEAQIHIQKKNYSQAASIVSDLKQKYPRVSAIRFLSGTVHYLNNNKAAAAEDLQAGLQIDPNNESAKKLLGQIKGTQ